jgi:RimJ/RimL family protein N-acetyltransferase
MNIRQITESDAESFLYLCKTIDAESDFMLFEHGERQTTVEQQRARIANMLKTGRSTIFVAEMNHRLVGYLAAIGGENRRNRHRAYIVIGILEQFTGKGIGTQLFKALEEWATKNDIHRLELTVMAHNERAIALYKKMGFEIEGIKKHSLLVKGKYVDEYYMAKLI